MKLYLQISYCLILLLCSCTAPEPELVQNAPTTADYMKSLQGPWQNKSGEIYYLAADQYSVFQNKNFYHAAFELNHDTLSSISMIEYPSYRAKITLLNKDSLKLKTIDSNKIFIFWRPSLEALMKDTVTITPDSIMFSEVKKIAAHLFEFSIRSDYEDHVFLRIKNLDADSMQPLIEDLHFRGGNCNFTETIDARFELKGDRLFIYCSDESVEHFDDTNPHGETDYRIHEWVFRKTGQIVSLGEKKGKYDSPVWKTVDEKLYSLKWY